ncbi:hypothetical protein THIOM_001641 [Candidatus Thiomargarita nelsonii]|uniref:Uncharacterized protein n=1 Tax=Candidatus Thiomargarita nelsonii TaxID=1003181 RepID=A0A176S3F7_9GAMM|nr:hypothetical protein THIOM_001641 [Candidatus Thiomargarita nelsonii]
MLQLSFVILWLAVEIKFSKNRIFHDCYHQSGMGISALRHYKDFCVHDEWLGVPSCPREMA